LDTLLGTLVLLEWSLIMRQGGRECKE